MPTPTTVLYIGGAGRSGSTLLDMILGNLNGMFSIGEARYFWEYNDRKDVKCGCGNLLVECDFWSRVVNHIKMNGDLDIHELALLSKRLNRSRHTLSLMFKPPLHTEQLVRALELYYTAIALHANTSIIVDASKVPSHLALLRLVPGIDLRVLHLVRDARAVAYSWSKRVKREYAIVNREAKMPRHSVVQSIITWTVENFLIQKISKDLPYTIMRYEDFTENPHHEISRALNDLGFGKMDLGILSGRYMDLNPTHSVGGNPIRFAGQAISIIPDTEWNQTMANLMKLGIGLALWPALNRFGYKLKP